MLLRKNWKFLKSPLKNLTFRGADGHEKTNIEGGGLLKKGDLETGGLARKTKCGVFDVFEGGWYPDAHYELIKKRIVSHQKI